MSYQNTESPDTPKTLEYARREAKENPRGKGFLALALTVLFPGLGHAFAGTIRRGVSWLILLCAVQIAGLICVVFPQAFVAVMLMVPVSLILYLACLVDGFQSGRHSRRPMLVHAWQRFVIGVVILVMSFLIFNPWTAIWLAMADFIKDRFAQSFVLSSNSMAPTLKPGDMFVAHKIYSEFDRWDVVVVHPPEDPTTYFALRVIGLPGEKVEIVNNGVRVNGKLVPVPKGVGPFISMRYMGRDTPSLRGRPGAGCEGNPILLRSSEYYLLGDNSTLAYDARVREFSYDGHQRGATPRSGIVGKITAIYWPPSRWRLFNSD